VARDYDTQLLESVAVRRRRLRDAALFGQHRTRRTLDENINKILIGLCIAAVACAGCVGWSVVQTQLLKQKKEQAAQSQTAPNPGAAQVPADWVGAQVTIPMLRTALSRARVPASLYVLPGQPRPPAHRTSSYYLLARNQTQFSAGIVEGREGRIGAEFGTEDEACRWMYGELVVKETRPARLTALQEQEAPRLAASLVADVKAKMAQQGGGSLAHPLPQGTLVDQFGQESGSALFPAGTPFAQRGQPPAARFTVNAQVPSNYHRYRVVRPFQVDASVVPAGSGGSGGAVRFTISPGLFSQPPALPSVRWLVRNGYLERITVATVPG
jgi:hypothetical protein